LFTNQFVTSRIGRCIRTQNYFLKGAHKSGTLLSCVVHTEPRLFCSRSSSRSEQSPLVTGQKITLSTKIPNRLMATTASSCCHSKLRSTRMKPTGTPRIWQICKRERPWAKFAKRIISRIKIIAICRSSGRPTRARAYSSTMADTVLSQSLSWN